VDWYRSIARIKVGNGRGTGVLLAEDLVLTAAHVLWPAGGAEPSLGDVVVELPWAGYLRPSLRAMRIHPLWQSNQNTFDADLALIRVDPTATAALPVGTFNPAREASLYGFPLDADDGVKSSFQNGHLRREGDSFFSRNFDVRDGMSGGPFLQSLKDETHVIGIATWDSNDPAQEAFNGIPIDSARVRDIWPWP
jgi:trypsin-like peptidase